MWLQIDGVEVKGQPPDLHSQTCEAFLCEAFRAQGHVEATANVTYLRFAGRWHRLYFDCGLIFWREHDGAPEAWAVPEEGWEYPIVDVGAEAGVVGVRLASYRMEPTAGGSRVAFTFENGRGVVLDNHADRTSYSAT